MAPNDRTDELLAQIPETQRAHFEEYRRVTTESLEMQRRATDAQARHLVVYRRGMVVGAIIIVGLIGYALWLGTLIR
ncbi:MAG: hypothetical protein FJ207_09760 [Gemmatimonadetes bacterium]|nr:hypothetical protein [Gemmatimonadota bacterium]